MFSPLFFFVSFFSSELSKGGRRWKIRENMVRDILSLFYITATRRRLREQRKGRAKENERVTGKRAKEIGRGTRRAGREARKGG